MGGLHLSRRTIRSAMLLAFGAVVVYFLWTVRQVLPPFVFAFALAYLLAPLVEFLEGHKVPRLLAILMVYSVLIGLIVVGLLYLVPAVITELNKLAENLPAYTRQVQQILAQLQANYSETVLPQSIREVIDRTVANIQTGLLRLIETTVTGLLNLVSGMVSAIIAPILAFYFLRDWEKMKRGMVRVLPSTSRSEGRGILAEMDEVIGAYLRSQLVVASIVGVLSGLWVAILGLRFATIFGIIAGVTNIIPYFGPIIGALPPTVFALITAPCLTWKVVLGFFVIQQLESNVIGPKIVGDTVGLHPLVVIFALLSGAFLFGFWGMVVAVPVAAIIRVLLGYIGRKWTEG
ncbi:MAG: AI-2E family transporter [Bacillota bacterium]